MNMQTIGSATPVLLVQTTTPQPEIKPRDSFGSEREYTKYLRKRIKELDKKPEDKKKEDEKKKKMFSIWEMIFIMMALSAPVAFIQIGLGYAFFKVVRILATSQ